MQGADATGAFGLITITPIVVVVHHCYISSVIIVSVIVAVIIRSVVELTRQPSDGTAMEGQEMGQQVSAGEPARGKRVVIPGDSGDRRQ